MGDVRRHIIQPLTELRLELENDDAIEVKLLNGTAEIFGLELVQGLEYPLGEEARVAVFSWTGCEVELVGRCTTEYLAEETPLPSHYNVHLALEQLRVTCRPPSSFTASSTSHQQPPALQQEDETSGPRVLVVGEEGSGKSTLCKSLLNWAIRAGKARRDGDWTEYGRGRKVLFVNLDPADGAFTIPGTFSAAAISTLLPSTTPIHPFGTTQSTSLPPLSQPSQIPGKAWSPSPALHALAPQVNALSFFYGHTDWGRNEGLTDKLLSRLGGSARRRIEESADEAIWRGGMIIDTPGAFVKKDKYAYITKCVREFEVNILLVVGNERMHVEMSKLLSTNKTVTVIRVPKNSGASPLDSTLRRKIQSLQTRSYFYGGPHLSLGTLAPHSISIRFDVLSVNRVGDESLVPLSALPIGHTRTIQDTQLVEISPEEAAGDLSGKIAALPQIEGSRRKKADKKPKESTAEAEPAVPATSGNGDVEKEEDTSTGTTAASGTADSARSSEVKQEEGEGKPDTTVAPVAAAEAKEEEEDQEEEERDEKYAPDEDIAASPVVGFVHLTQLDTTKHKYTVLSPLPGKLPRTKLLIGSLEWQES